LKVRLDIIGVLHPGDQKDQENDNLNGNRRNRSGIYGKGCSLYDQETFGIPKANILLKNMSRSAGPIAQGASYAPVIHIRYRKWLEVLGQNPAYDAFKHEKHLSLPTLDIFITYLVCNTIKRTVVTRSCKLLYFT
jgi:hypothetical protein